MRKLLILLALLACACSGGERTDRPAPAEGEAAEKPAARPARTRPAEPARYFRETFTVTLDGMALADASEGSEPVFPIVVGETYEVERQRNGWARLIYADTRAWAPPGHGEITRERLSDAEIAKLEAEFQAAARCKLHGLLNSSEYRPTDRINFWQRADRDRRGSVTGRAIPGSWCLVLDETGDAVKVRSPLDQSEGWVSRMQFDRFAKRDTQTREFCGE